EVLRSDWLTTGPQVDAFEQAVIEATGASHAVAVSNGTAALHAAMFGLGIGPGDEVIVPAITFAATANSVVYQGGTPVFADVDPETLLIDPASVQALISPHTRAIVAVDYAGQPCDYDTLRQQAADAEARLVADACHALGARYQGSPVGSLADSSTFSFHPVKPITTAEGGMITTCDEALAQRMRRFRNHGITTDHRQREAAGSWFYEMTDLGFNYRLSDLQCALGISQLRRLPEWMQKRQALARRYDAAFAGIAAVQPLTKLPEREHAYHLYVVKLVGEGRTPHRQTVFERLRAAGLGVNVHYIPVHLHPYYQRTFRTHRGQCPNAEAAYEQILSLPFFPAMTEADVDRVVEIVVTTLESTA
ncbi:MAG: UDP-4-amino-4,6-dideoxy-N-acetyl-beta-L-altrosamine transaminase, partial [Acidobacteriota bacterium]